MKQARRNRFAIFLLSTLLAGNSFAQEFDDTTAPDIPDLASLQTSEWSYFEGSRSEVEPKAEVFYAQVETEIAELTPQNEAVANTLLVAVRNNISAYLALLEGAEPAARQLDPAPIEYSIDGLMRLARSAREAESDAREELLSVEREQRMLAGASRRRDTAFGAYVDAAAGDERWLAGMRLLQARSAQAISARRLTTQTSTPKQRLSAWNWPRTDWQRRLRQPASKR